MGTKLLTPKTPAVVGYWEVPPAPILGWKLGQDNAVDVMTSVNVIVGVAGYRGELLCNPGDNGNIWVVRLFKRDHPTVEAEGNKWILFDGVTPFVKNHDFVIANYDITDAPLAPPTPAPEPQPDPEPEETP